MLTSLGAYALKSKDQNRRIALLGSYLGKHQIELELARASLTEEPAADFLGAILPEARVKPGVAPACGAIALNVADQVRLGRVGRQRGQADN
ncbi:MAG: hypothetical protein ABI606_22885, partial [Rhodoferax sp.]